YSTPFDSQPLSLNTLRFSTLTAFWLMAVKLLSGRFTAHCPQRFIMSPLRGCILYLVAVFYNPVIPTGLKQACKADIIIEKEVNCLPLFMSHLSLILDL